MQGLSVHHRESSIKLCSRDAVVQSMMLPGFEELAYRKKERIRIGGRKATELDARESSKCPVRKRMNGN